MITKKTLSLLLAVIMISMTFTAFPITANAVENTWDPDNGVYDITTEDDLFAFNEAFWQQKYYEGITVNLLSDISISEGKTWKSAPSNSDEGAAFSGTFNGNGHTISNLNMVSSDNYTVSFLPFLSDATIKDLTLKDVTIENGYTWNAAFACVSLGDDTISNCHLIGNCVIKPSYAKAISGNWKYTAGIVADNYMGSLKIENCSVGGDGGSIEINDPNANYSSSNNSSGGILAYLRKNTSAEIISTDNYADVGAFDYSAGILGVINGNSSSTKATAKIYDCHNYGDIIANQYITSQIVFCGGIVGYDTLYSNLVIDRCSNHGDVTVGCKTSTDVGGLAGMLHCAAVLNSYNTGKVESKVESTTIGGLVGHFRVNSNSPAPDVDLFDYYPDGYYNAIINCYNTGDVIGGATESTGGLCGYVQDIYTKPRKSVIKNAYNFGTVSGTGDVATVSPDLQDTRLQDVYGIDDAELRTLSFASIHDDNAADIDLFTSNVGYFDSPDVTGTVYPATANIETANNSDQPIVETVSSTPLTGNLLSLLNAKVDEYNAELEANGSEYRYLTWKMTNPASEDGSTGVTVHPMFGIQEFDVNFYANFAENEEPFRTYTAADLVMGKVPVFYDLPAHEGYIFKGWYLDKENNDDDSPISFDTVYTASADIYAHWIKVDNVKKDENDPSMLQSGEKTYGGFDLVGVQIRKEMRDYNFDDKPKMPGGLRFITSLSMDVVKQINAIKPNNIEYGYVAATHKEWIDYHKGHEKLQYVSTSANGINTTKTTKKDEDYFGFAHNVKCTSRIANSQNNEVRVDHQNFGNYLLYSFVVTYEGDDAARKDTNVLARPYIHYTDANGLERVAYSDYRGTSNTLGGCYTSYKYVAERMAPSGN